MTPTTLESKVNLTVRAAYGFSAPSACSSDTKIVTVTVSPETNLTRVPLESVSLDVTPCQV